MPRLPVDFYAGWRRPAEPAPALQEGGLPPERWLQQVWRHQRLRRADLRTLDGRPVRVLHPGFWNREPGPDFRQAVVQIGSEPPRTGDVEIDLAVGGWQGHRHAGNPAYSGVILHAVWEAVPASHLPPVLQLRPFLDTPLAELTPWLDGEAESIWPVELSGRCCAPLQTLDAETLAELLQQAAGVRLQRKAAELAARARLQGWDGALWEGLFAALGYKHNVWPCRRLAELVAPRAGHEDAATFEARLLGLAGLLPAELPRSTGATHARKLWDIWWRERDAWADLALPLSLWHLAGIRPANHPQRRLALAAQWLADGEFIPRLERWLTQPGAGEAELLKALLPEEAHPFWSHHWTLRSQPVARPQPLLGTARATDLAMNVILPWLFARASAGRGSGRNPELLATIRQRHLAWPAGEDNSALKLARQRLFGGTVRRLPRTAAAQQGLLQITRDFCGQTDPLCSGCRFPELVRALPGAAGVGSGSP